VSTLGEDRVLSLLQGALAAARAAGASDAEACYEGGALGVTRFANSYVTQAGMVIEGRARVRAAIGDRVGAASTSVVDPEGLAEAARLAVEIARHRRPVDSFAGFARVDPARPMLARARFVEATAALDPRQHAVRCKRIFARTERDGLLAAGALHTGPTELGVVTSGGVARHLLASEALLELVVLDGTSSGYAVFYGPDLGTLDDAALADEACRAAVRGREVVEVEPGPLDVVLAPAAVAEALEWMALTSFSGRALLDGASLLAGRETGQPLCSAEITIRDDAGHEHPQALPLPFDPEGTTRLPVTFIDRGRAGQVVTDLASSRKLKDPRGSTGHAAAVTDESSEGPHAANLVLEPGDASLETLLGRVERGLYVTRFHYVNGYLDPRAATMTGMTRDGTFLIRDGKLGPAVPNLRWTESFLEALGRLGGVGSELACVPSRWTSSMGSILCPPLLIRGFRFTGRSR
jgi:predicted Zn-dependent protease